MKHVKEIREMLDHGQTSEAGEAIDILLELGPHNTEALKLKALIFQQQGRFNREYEIWERVVSIDPEDEDAITYFRLRHIEDREHFYFTDDLPGGGRRFLAYPSALIRATFLALVGCVVFLVFTRFTIHYPGLENPLVLLPVFVISVLIPWIGTILVWVKSLRSISLTQKFEVSTRFHSLTRLERDRIHLLSTLIC
ncbi:MAG: tetratricopeptide repeat protein [Bdellovibrionota bacterium]